MRKSIKSVMAFALAAALAASTLAPATTASAASKVNVITKATYSGGDTVKYTYNGKGLVTKSVSTDSFKDNDSDTTTTTTTTFKYNKKNKVSSKTSKTVKKTTTYETDYTTGLKLGAKKGTITNTTTSVTNFTYDKKGLATQSVTTTTTTKSGSRTWTDKSIFSSNDDYYYSNTEINDGKILAGYNSYNNDGTENEDGKNTINNAYYYDGVVADTESTTTYTETYTDNGNGTYTIVSSSESKPAHFSTERVYKYFGKETVNGVETVVPLTKSETPITYTDSDGDTYTTYYKKADGSAFTGYTYSIVDKVTIKKDANSTSSSSSNNTSVVSNKSVTTTKYTYDKKKRVKKAVSTTVSTDETKSTNQYSGTSSSETGSNKNESTSKSELLKEKTSVSTTTYTYNKKGQATKKVYSNEGKEDSKTISSNLEVSSSNESTRKNEDGSTYTNKSSSSYELSAGFPTVKTTVVKDGVSTITTTKNPYKYTHNSEYTDKSYSNKNSYTSDVTYYGNGGRKTVQTYSNSYSNTYDGSTYSSSQTGTKTSYNFDEKGKSNGYIDVYTSNSSTSTKPYEGSDAYYTDGKDSSNDVAATQKIEAAKAALEATGTVYTKVEGTKTVLAAPSKATTTYKYDKAGNVKSAKESGTTTVIEDVKNETYGNIIYKWDASGELVADQIAVTHKYADNDAMENTVKKGAKILTKKLTINKYSHDRYNSGSSYLSRVLYTIKGKKSSTAKLVNKQQWIIQNSDLNGEVGLN